MPDRDDLLIITSMPVNASLESVPTDKHQKCGGDHVLEKYLPIKNENTYC